MKKNYKVGDVVWVKMRGSPWWPASIQLPKTKQQQQEFEDIMEKNNKKETRLFVIFFGDNSYYFAKNTKGNGEILPFEERKEEMLKRCHSKLFKKAVEEAEEYVLEEVEEESEEDDESKEEEQDDDDDKDDKNSQSDSNSDLEAFEPRASLSPSKNNNNNNNNNNIVISEIAPSSTRKKKRNMNNNNMLSSPPASQPHAIVRSASRTPGGTRRIKWIGKSIGNGIDREKYYDGFRLDRDEYHVGDCVFVRMDDEEDDLWVAELESLWEDKYKEKWFEGRWFYSALNARAHSNYGQGRNGNNRNWTDAISRHELYESDHVDENTIDCVEGKAKVITQQEFQTYNRSKRNSQQEQTFFCKAFYSTKTRMIRPILGATKRVQRAKLYSNRLIDALSDNDDEDEDDEEDDSEEEEDEIINSKKRKKNNSNNNSSSRKNKKKKKKKNQNTGSNTTTTTTTTTTMTTTTTTNITSNNNNKNKKKQLFENCAKACAALQLSHVPKSLPCREKERKQVMHFLKSAVERGGLGSALYISGMPGTGKTATVMEVIRTLKENARRGLNPDFEFIELNGMKLPHPYEAYSIIWRGLTGQDAAPKKAASLLERRFATPSSKRQCCVLLVDELDYMVTRKQSVLYNLFDWPSKRYSRLVVVGIANTMDLPERLLPRIHSRLGLERVIFPGYTVPQIETIMKARLGELDVFEDTAVEICARKVASISGDIRRALQIARRAAEICDREANEMAEEIDLNNTINNNNNRSKDPYVTIRHINLAHKELTTTAYILAIKHASLFERLLLASVVLQIRGSGLEEVMYDDVMRRFEGLCRTRGGPISHHPSRTSTKSLCRRLASSGLIVLDQRSTDWDWQPKIRLNVLPDDVVYALSGDNTTRSLF